MLEAVGGMMVDEAQQIVPYAVGTLSESITYHVDVHGSGGRFDFPSLWFGATAPYAAAVEFGHHTKNGGWVEPQPFLRPIAYKYRNVIPTR